MMNDILRDLSREVVRLDLDSTASLAKPASVAFTLSAYKSDFTKWSATQKKSTKNIIRQKRVARARAMAVSELRGAGD